MGMLFAQLSEKSFCGIAFAIVLIISILSRNGLWCDRYHHLLIWVNNAYRPKSVYITENGAGLHENWDGRNGTVADPRRVDYLKRHVRAAWEAKESGVPLDGYFCWSFLDNFEWGYGYAKRFGMVYIDYPTKKRIPKESYSLWRDYATGKLKP